MGIRNFSVQYLESWRLWWIPSPRAIYNDLPCREAEKALIHMDRIDPTPPNNNQ